jgi:formate dehydrogenase assembly factor FdhD
MAVDAARRAGLTLVGFARGNRMNIYSGEERIITD